MHLKKEDFGSSLFSTDDKNSSFVFTNKGDNFFVLGYSNLSQDLFQFEPLKLIPHPLLSPI